MREIRGVLAPELRLLLQRVREVDLTGRIWVDSIWQEPCAHSNPSGKAEKITDYSPILVAQ